MASVDELFKQAMKLTPAERGELSDKLFQSTLPEAPGQEITGEEWERAWHAEIMRRYEEMDRGEVELKDAFECLDELRRKLRAERLANTPLETPGS